MCAASRAAGVSEAVDSAVHKAGIAGTDFTVLWFCLFHMFQYTYQ